MEEEKGSYCWSSETNWTINEGNLQDFITFETPISPIEEDKVAISKSHQLLLNSPSPDSGPCEVTVSFRNLYEVRQVYVRSTARTYEMYYAPEQKSTNEYLCTVCCGVVAKEDGILHEGNAGDDIAECEKDSSEATKPSEGKVKSCVSSSSDEDGWIEVKVPISPPLDNTANPTSKKIDENTSKNAQDYYEATAEINDGPSCSSLTLRLLSLQTKGCVQVEEIYIYAEPVEPTDGGHQVGLAQTSSGSSLLAMFVPSLLQLSNTATGRIQERHVSDTQETQKHQDNGANGSVSPQTGRKMEPEKHVSDLGETQRHQNGEMEAIESVSLQTGRTVEQETTSKIADPTEVKSQGATGESTKPMRVESSFNQPAEEGVRECVSDEKNSAQNRLENMLNQLVFRVCRMESFCLRFEENMVKPLNSIATRLERVERQLDTLTQRSQFPESFHCTRIAASDFLCDQTETNSHSDPNDEQSFSASESVTKNPHIEKSYSPAGDVTASDSPTELSRCLVVTAPEFSNHDDSESDDENCNASINSMTNDFSTHTPAMSMDDADDTDDLEMDDKNDCPTRKRAVSIDDALASSLAAFLSSVSVQSPADCPSMVVKAPDFANDVDGKDVEAIKDPLGISLSQEREEQIYHQWTHHLLRDAPHISPSQGGEEQVQHQRTQYIPTKATSSTTIDNLLKFHRLLRGPPCISVSQEGEPQIDHLSPDCYINTTPDLAAGVSASCIPSQDNELDVQHLTRWCEEVMRENHLEGDKNNISGRTDQNSYDMGFTNNSNREEITHGCGTSYQLHEEKSENKSGRIPFEINNGNIPLTEALFTAKVSCGGINHHSIGEYEMVGTENVKRVSTPSISSSHNSEVQLQHHMELPEDSPIKATTNIVTKNRNSTKEEIRERIIIPNHVQVESTENNSGESNGEEIVFQSPQSMKGALESSRDTTKIVQIQGQLYAEESGDKHQQALNTLLDFQFPILEVKFDSQESCSSGLSLEDLLGVANTGSPSMQLTRDGETSASDHSNQMVQVEFDEPKAPAAEAQFLLQLEDFAIEYASLGPEGEQRDTFGYSSHEPVSSLI